MTNRTIRRWFQHLWIARRGRLRLSVLIDHHVVVSPVAIYARTHRERVLLRYTLHRLDRAVARLAANVSGHMPAVIECYEIRHVIDLDPFDRLVLIDGGIDLFHVRLVCRIGQILIDLAVAVHTSCNTWHACRLRFISVRVAVHTVDLVITRVDLVRKIDRLHRFIPELVTIDHERLRPKQEECSDERDQQRNNYQRP